MLNNADSYTDEGTTGGGSPLIEAGVGFNLLLGPSLDIDIGISYQNYLGLYGLNYVVDPRTPYTELSQQREWIDFIQFPRQTLEYRAGDCDDLSILYCALLESVGIETAFITVPGHILMAFSCLISLYLNELFFQITHQTQEIRQLIVPILDSYDAIHLSMHQSFCPGKRSFYFV
ncbi:MAG: transglutaminase domain-containing protein [Spirochaetales bacterium]|nr:transglutaminase domain-containing protein [Spirochaetales bacterium]